MEKACPIFKRENLLYEREEKERYWTIVPKFHPETRELVINFTARKILELCNGKRTIEEIVEEMKNNFPTIPKETIQRDVYDTIGGYSRLLIIEWIGENPFLYKRETILSDDLTLVIAQEDDILRIKKFIDNFLFQENRQIDDKPDLFLYKSPGISTFEYEEVALRAKLFSFGEEFFLLIRGEEISGFISISPPIVPYATAGMFKIICAPKDFIGDILRYAYDNLPFISINNITKIRIQESTSEKLEPDLEKVLLNDGYKEEWIMEHELGFNNHLRSLVKYYSEAFIEKIENQRGWKK